MDLKYLKDNILSNRWKQRYESLPEEVKEKLESLNNSKTEEYQLQVIQRKRIYPEAGDVFLLNPWDEIFLKGIVVNNHINNINGEDLILILIFKPDTNIDEALKKGVKKEDLLIAPVIVGKEYWTRGYFNNIANNRDVKNIREYGFYSIGKGKFLDEYGTEILKEPALLGTYGVATITGIAKEVDQELIILGVL